MASNPRPDLTWEDVIEMMASSDLTQRREAENSTKYLQAYMHIDQEEELFNKGDKAALFHALEIALRYRLEMPEWIRDGFVDGYKTIRALEKGSWDDAFGKPIPKGMHLKKLRQKRNLRPQVYSRIKEILSSERVPIDDGLFERVGEEFGIGKTLAGELYYQIKLNFREK